MLDELKVFLGISDRSVDDVLNIIITDATARLKLLLGGIDPPAEMAHIIREVSVIRYNRIGSEGVSAHTVEGESMQFVEDDFAQYHDEITAFLEGQKSAKRGRVKFL